MQAPTASRHRWVMCPTPQLGGTEKTWGDDGKWVWINTYENTILSGLFTSINPSYFVHQGYKVLTHPQVMIDG